jgi:hypothetical protein
LVFRKCLDTFNFKSSIEKSAQYEFDSRPIYSEKLALYQLDLKELSKISAEIDFEKSQKIEIKNEKRKSIFEFLKLYSDLIYGALDIKVLDYGYNNYEEIKSRL